MERTKHPLRRILNLDSLITHCSSMSAAGGAVVECMRTCFDGNTNYPALLRMLQTFDVLVREEPFLLQQLSSGSEYTPLGYDDLLRVSRMPSRRE